MNRRFRADEPNRLWLTDITEFRLPGGEKVYSGSIVDCFDGMPVAWSTLHPRQAPRELEPAQGLRGEAGGGRHDDPLGLGRPLPLAGVDRDLRGERPGQEHVREGLQPGQLGLRGLLRAPKNEFFRYRDWEA